MKRCFFIFLIIFISLFFVGCFNSYKIFEIKTNSDPLLGYVNSSGWIETPISGNFSNKDFALNFGVQLIQYKDISEFIAGNDVKYVFKNWSDASEENDREELLEKSTIFIANFIKYYKVESQDANLNKLLQEWNKCGEIIELIAPEKEGYIFSHWEINGEDVSESIIINLMITEPKSIKLIYEEEEYTNLDFKGPVYNGNLLLVANESTDGNNMENVGTVNNFLPGLRNSSINDALVMINPVIPFRKETINKSDLLNEKTSLVDKYELGEDRSFWTNDFETNEYQQISATLQYLGTNVEVWAENTSEIDLNKAMLIGEEFDEVIWDLINTYFYYPSDLDGNGKIAILCFDIQDGFSGSGGYVGGYFNPFDLYDVSGSNKMEIFYIDTYPTMHYPKENPIEVSNSFSILAHEFQHMVNFNRNVLIEDGDYMATWLNEALSMAAEHIYGGVQTDRIDYYNGSGSDSIRNGHSLLYWDYFGDVLPNYSLSYLMGQYIRIQMNKGNYIFKDLIISEFNDYKCVEEAIHSNIDIGLDFNTFMTYFRLSLILKEATGYFGFGGEEGFDSIETLVSDNLPENLRGGGAFFSNINGESYEESGDQGENIIYVGISQ